jgi:hypothetical protein
VNYFSRNFFFQKKCRENLYLRVSLICIYFLPLLHADITFFSVTTASFATGNCWAITITVASQNSKLPPAAPACRSTTIGS